MQAMVYTEYGALEVLQPQEVENPVPMENEVLVRVHAASVNPHLTHVSLHCFTIDKLPFLSQFDGDARLQTTH